MGLTGEVTARRNRGVPEDVLNEVGLYLSAADVRHCVLVSRAWCSAFCSDRIWAAFARRHFIKLPILRLSRGVSASSRQLPPPPAQCVGGGTLRQVYMQKRYELKMHQVELRTLQEVKLSRPLVLHAILGTAWASIILFLSLLILNMEGYPLCTIDQTFAVLHTAFAAIFASVMFNVMASAHYEPHPLFERIKRHSQLISLTGVTSAVLLAFWVITRMFQYNVTSPQDERLPWVMCFTPALCLLGFWQLLAGLAARPSLLRWLRRPRVPTLVQLHAVLTTVFPSGLMLAITSFGTYIETGQVGYLIAAECPFLLATLSVTATFFMDYAAYRKFGDLVAGFSLLNLSCFPLGFLLFEPRGLLILPLLLFVSSFALSYLNQWLKKGKRERKTHEPPFDIRAKKRQ